MKYAPKTPGGTVCTWLIAETEEAAWEKLLADVPLYSSKAELLHRGYTMVEIKQGTRQWKPSHRNARRK